MPHSSVLLTAARRATPRLALGAALAVGLTAPLVPEPGADALRLVSATASASPAPESPAPESAAPASPAAESPAAGSPAPESPAPSAQEPAAEQASPTAEPTPTLAPVLQTVDSPIRFRTVRKADATRYKGVEEVVQQGRSGVLRREYLVVGAGGSELSRTMLSEEQVRAPRPRVVAVGTKARPRYRTDLDWAALARCESGGNPRATNPSGKYRGLYQFDLRTWRSVGGTGDPIAHDRDEQTYRASRLYEQRGRSPWPHCGRYL